MKLTKFIEYVSGHYASMHDAELALGDLYVYYYELENKLAKQEKEDEDEYQIYERLKAKFEISPNTYIFDENRSEAVSEMVYDSTKQELTVRYRSNVNVAYTYDVIQPLTLQSDLDFLESGYKSVGGTLIYWKSSGVIGHYNN